MKKYSFENQEPRLGLDNYLAPGVHLIGKVILGDRVNIWFNTVVRGDVNLISIGTGTNIQDLCMLHVTEEYPLEIGEGVSVGHSAILHGCKIGRGSLIGMGAKVLDGAVIGEECLVAAGSVVPPGKEYPPGSLIMGAPAKVVKQLPESQRKSISSHYNSYMKYAEQFSNPEVFKELL